MLMRKQNDFNTEGINNKSDALLALVKSLKSEGLIDGVGFQSHFIVGEVPPDLQANLQRFVDAGVEVAITELDIRVRIYIFGPSPKSTSFANPNTRSR